MDPERECSGPAGSLRICHERIKDQPMVHEGRREKRTKWCWLKGHHFCWDDCAFYCSTHAIANHSRHRVEVVT